MATFTHDTLTGPPVTLDGGLATHLEVRGNSVASALWSAEILQNRPEEVRAAHHDFFLAGAKIATTCSYQATYEGYATVGLNSEQVDELLLRSVRLAQEARQLAGLSASEAWIAASVGPYGASPGAGTEYDGAYGLSVAELREWHRPRLRVLADSGADLLLAETIPSLPEVEALCDLLAEESIPSLLSLTVADSALRSGESIREAAAFANAVPQIVGIGVNCSSIPDATVALRILAEVSDKPLLVYPNSGEVWDAGARSWHGQAETVESHVSEWVDLGAQFIGGCCRVDTESIQKIATQLKR